MKIKCNGSVCHDSWNTPFIGILASSLTLLNERLTHKLCKSTTKNNRCAKVWTLMNQFNDRRVHNNYIISRYDRNQIRKWQKMWFTHFGHRRKTWTFSRNIANVSWQPTEYANKERQKIQRTLKKYKRKKNRVRIIYFYHFIAWPLILFVTLSHSNWNRTTSNRQKKTTTHDKNDTSTSTVCQRKNNFLFVVVEFFNAEKECSAFHSLCWCVVRVFRRKKQNKIRPFFLFQPTTIQIFFFRSSSVSHTTNQFFSNAHECDSFVRDHQSNTDQKNSFYILSSREYFQSSIENWSSFFYWTGKNSSFFSVTETIFTFRRCKKGEKNKKNK